MSVDTKDPKEGSLADAVAELLDVGSRTGISMLSAIFGATTSVLGTAGPAVTRRRSHAGCNCRIPPPCWEPQPLGTFGSRACPGSTATIRIRVTNCGSSPRTARIEPSPSSKGLVIKPPQLELGPEERGYSVVSFEVAPDAAEGGATPHLLRLSGCTEPVLRWLGSGGLPCGP